MIKTKTKRIQKAKAFSLSQNGIEWGNLIPGVLIRRYKRFLADIELETGTTITAHCPNPGSMMSCCEPGRRVYVSKHDDPNRKLNYTWQMIDMPDSLVCVNSVLPNDIVSETLRSGKIEPLKNYANLRREVALNRSRIDVLLFNDDKDRCYVEIKNCTMVQDGIAAFPDAVTQRGRKHLLELQQLTDSGYRCVMFYLIQRMDATVFQPADAIDPEYGKTLRQAVQNGVEILAYDVTIDMKHIGIRSALPVEL